MERVIEIYMAGREKTSHLLVDPPTSVTDVWTLDDNVLLYQILTTMEPKIQDLVCMIVKELWYFLKDLYGGSGNINRAYDVYPLVVSEKAGWSAYGCSYGKYNCLADKLRQIFSIMSDVKQMQNQ